MSLNKVIMIARLTRDPQLSYLPSQTSVVEFGVAHNRKYKVNGEQREDVCFAECKAYGKTADGIKQWFSKGTEIGIDGRLGYEQWEDKQGQKRSKNIIIVERWTFGSGGERRQEGQQEDAKEYNPGVNEDGIPF